MKNCQVHEPARPGKFHEIKQLQYFKQILRKTQDFHLKQILPLHVYRIAAKILDHDKYAYIPQKSVEQCHGGVLIDQSISQLSKKTVLYRIDKKLDIILRKAITLNIPIIQNLKTYDRFAILNQCCIQNYPFNRTIHRKGEHYRGAYFIIVGQVKIISEKNNQLSQTVSQNNFIGLEQLFHESTENYYTILSNCNTTQILLFNLQMLASYFLQQQQCSVKQLFIKFYQTKSHNKPRSKFKSRQNSAVIFQNMASLTKRKLQEEKKTNKVPLKLNNFIRKCDQFMSKIKMSNCISRQKDKQKEKERDRQDKGFNQYIKSKKILLQLRETMAAAKLNRKNKTSRNLNIKNDQFEQNRNLSKPKLNTNMVTCRSNLLKQHILKRLTWGRSFQDNWNMNQMQQPKIYAQKIKIHNSRELR